MPASGGGNCGIYSHDEIGDIAGVVITRALRANLESKVGDFEASLELSLKEIGVDYKDLTKRCS